MSKILKLKEWLTISEAARFLSIAFGEEVSDSDVLRFSLDDDLVLSFNFVNGGIGKCGHLMPIEVAEYELLPMLQGGKDFKYYGGPILKTNGLASHVLKLREEVCQLNGIYDLPMIGGERLDVEHAYHQLTSGPKVATSSYDGAFVKAANGLICQLQVDFEDNEFTKGSKAFIKKLHEHIANQEMNPSTSEYLIQEAEDLRRIFLEERNKQHKSEHFYPAGGLPDDGVLVVRSKALQKFIASVNDSGKSENKPLSTTERNSLFKMLIGMAVQGYGYDPKASKSPIPKQIADDLAELGISISDDTVRNYLKDAAQIFLEGKAKS